MTIDKEYKTVEAIALMCYSFGLIMVCVTKFVPFIFLLWWHIQFHLRR